jgi:putative addiction module component (TIGR02574 family)
MSIDEIKKLNSKEKIILMNEIWESFEDKNSTIKSPDWHQEILEKRVSKIKNGEAKYISLDELKNR